VAARPTGPVPRAWEDEADGSDAGAGRRRVTARVVLADDVVDLREMMRFALELTGEFTVVAEAGDGEAAVRAVEEHQPDALLIDLAMPLMDGVEAIPRIRRVAPDCRILVFSGFDHDSMRQTAMERGAHAFLVKGMLPRDVVEALRQQIAARDRGGAQEG
jgi:DNA-binding NarL/FixJ family response regulator